MVSANPPTEGLIQWSVHLIYQGATHNPMVMAHICHIVNTNLWLKIMGRERVLVKCIGIISF